MKASTDETGSLAAAAHLMAHTLSAGQPADLEVEVLLQVPGTAGWWWEVFGPEVAYELTIRGRVARYADTSHGPRLEVCA